MESLACWVIQAPSEKYHIMACVYVPLTNDACRFFVTTDLRCDRSSLAMRRNAIHNHHWMASNGGYSCTGLEREGVCAVIFVPTSDCNLLHSGPRSNLGSKGVVTESHLMIHLTDGTGCTVTCESVEWAIGCLDVLEEWTRCHVHLGILNGICI